MTFDESALETENSVSARDPSRLLFSLATAGAQVREAAERFAEADRSSLAEAAPPRSLLVASDAPGSAAAGVLNVLAGETVPVVGCAGSSLPRWAGAADALLVASLDGRHPRLAALVDQASRRGLVVVVVAPAESPVASAGRVVLVDVTPVHPRAARWTLLTPLLQAAVELGVVDAAAAPWDAVSGALDAVAENCRPSGDPFTTTAKQLAVEFAEAAPLIAGAGPLAALAAASTAEALGLLGGVPAVALRLPDDMARAGALLTGFGAASDEDDFFRDRSEDQAARPRLLIIGDEDGSADAERERADGPSDDAAALRAAQALHDLVSSAGTRSSTVEVPSGPPLARYAAAVAFGDFTAAYLGIGRGLDPGAPRPGELSH